VLSSRVIADPLHLLECCMVSDGGGAIVIAAPEVARGTKKKPVWIIGTGEATKYSENGGDLTVSAGAQSGPVAFGSRREPADRHRDDHDSFTITVMAAWGPQVLQRRAGRSSARQLRFGRNPR
jgi:acetyl-CoA C-acetyltransferase